MKRLCLMLLPLLALLVCVTARAEERHADHEALRNILKTGTQALNSGKLDAMAPLLHSQFTIITVDNQKFSSLEAFKAYWDSLFQGEHRLLDKLEAAPVADELTQFLSEDVGLVHGVSNDVYTFRDGSVRTMPTRWTAVVAREGGSWKLVKLHFSVNLLDNPMLTATKEYALRGVLAVGVVLLLLGAILGYWLGRRRSRV
ncbi:YybH family protein [Chitinimonas sp. JJ19]|uniref:YybH family protein n=1 Tax=Chitinimonas sp. JJ19 TaxID=3109352 RepID=UPI002FFECCEB